MWILFVGNDYRSPGFLRNFPLLVWNGAEMQTTHKIFPLESAAQTLPPAPREGHASVCPRCVTDEKLSARNWSGICVQAHTSSPRGHGSGQLHVKFMRGTSFRFTQGSNKDAIKTLKDSSHNKQKHVALKKLLTVHRLHGCYQHPTL